MIFSAEDTLKECLYKTNQILIFCNNDMVFHVFISRQRTCAMAESLLLYQSHGTEHLWKNPCRDSAGRIGCARRKRAPTGLVVAGLI